MSQKKPDITTEGHYVEKINHKIRQLNRQINVIENILMLQVNPVAQKSLFAFTHLQKLLTIIIVQLENIRNDFKMLERHYDESQYDNTKSNYKRVLCMANRLFKQSKALIPPHPHQLSSNTFDTPTTSKTLRPIIRKSHN